MYKIGDVVSNGDFERIVLKSGDGWARMSCTNKDHKQHVSGKCYWATLWGDKEIEYNNYTNVIGSMLTEDGIKAYYA